MGLTLTPLTPTLSGASKHILQELLDRRMAVRQENIVERDEPVIAEPRQKVSAPLVKLLLRNLEVLHALQRRRRDPQAPA